jgi:hypothetical protein
MSSRTRCTSVTFAHPFELNGIGRIFSPGDYRVVTDEELVKCLSFPVYRRVATMIFVPVAPRHTSSVDMVVIDPRDLRAARLQDRAAHQTPDVRPTRLAQEPYAYGQCG